MKKISLLLALFLCTLISQAQKKIEGVAAIVGSKVILHSAIETQYMQMNAQGYVGDEHELKCQIFEELLYQKLLANQAEVDSIEVTDVEVADAIEQRINYFVSQIGSEQKLAEYFGKSITELKEEFKSVFREQMLAQRMEGRISSGIKATPEDVRKFYQSIPQDSLPFLPMEIQLSQIVLFPEVSKKEKERVTKKLLEFKTRVEGGEDFKFLATLYSDDKGSAKNGGDLGFVARGVFVPAFESAAYRLQEGELSDVIQTKFGFHLIQMIARRGEQINVRHILRKAKVNSTALYQAKVKIDAIAKEINDGLITFDEAVVKYSDDENKSNGGLLLNPNTMSTLHALNDMPPALRVVVDKLSVNEVSSPSVIQMQDENKAYRILRLNKRIEEHKANLVDDFAKIKEYSINAKKQEALDEWTKKTIAKTYIKVSDGEYEDCKFLNKWVK